MGNIIARGDSQGRQSNKFHYFHYDSLRKYNTYIQGISIMFGHSLIMETQDKNKSVNKKVSSFIKI